MPPIEAPTTACRRSIDSASSRRLWLATMSRMEKRGNARPGCSALFEGELLNPLPIASTARMQYCRWR